MELASKYNPADVEGKWYQYWLDHNYSVQNPMVVSLTPSSFRPLTSPACSTWDTCLIIPFKIFWYAVPVWKVKMPAGYRVLTTLLSLRKRR